MKTNLNEARNAYLDKLQKIVATPLQFTKLKYNGNSDAWNPGKRVSLLEIDDHDDRTVALNEIVFDFDFSSWKKNFQSAQTVIEVLEEYNIPFTICATGGKGIHIHIFFKKLNRKTPEYREALKKAFSYGMTWKHIRRFIWDMILDEATIPNKFRGSGKRLDSNVITFDYFKGSTHLIRDIGGKKKTIDDDSRTSTAYKTFIPISEFKQKKITVTNIENVRYPEEIKGFDINEGWIIDNIHTFIKNAEARGEHTTKNERLDIPYTEIDGILQIKEGLGEGQRSLGALVLSVAGRIDRLKKDEIKDILEEYVKNCSAGTHKFTLNEAMGWADWVYSQETVFWNCQQLEDLGVHDSDTCEFCQSKHKESFDFLKKSNLLQRVEKVLNVEIVGEIYMKMLSFLLMLSKDFPSETGKPGWNISGDPMSQNIILASDSSSGKSYVAKRLMELFGEVTKDYFVISRVSKSALNYLEDINMDGKIFFIEELQGLDHHTEQLRVWMSEGSLTFQTVEKVKGPDGVEKNASHTKTTIGQPVFVTCQAEGVVEEQFNNRSWVLSMDCTPQQTAAILEYQDKLAVGAVQQDKKEVQIIKDALKQLKPYHFRVPFMNYTLLNIPTDDVRARRDYQKFKTLIMTSAYLHQKQREIIKDDAEREFLVCTLDDYEVALNYATNILGATFSGLTLQQIELLSHIQRSGYQEEFVIGDLMRMLGKSHTHWRGQLAQLEDVGYVIGDKEQGKTTIYKLNADNKVGVLTLPTRKELEILLKAYKETPESGLLSPPPSFIKPESENTPSCEKHDFEKDEISHDDHFSLSGNPDRGLKSDEFPTGHLKVNRVCRKGNFHHLSDGKCSLANPFDFQVKDILSYFDSSKKHLIDDNELIEKFGNSVMDSVEKLVKEGSLMEVKPAKYMKI